MPTRKQWTEAEDALIRAMEAAGRSTEDIARLIGCSRTTVRWRGQELGINRWTGHKPPPQPDRPEPARIEMRDPLPAGHQVSWGAIVTGTCLDGEEYRP